MKNQTILIGDVEPFSIVDFPEHIAAVVFLQGCPWKCPFCYNTSLQKIGAAENSEWDFEKLTSFLQKRKNMLDAVVFSGGEPLVHEGLREAAECVKQMGFAVGLHTGGYRPDALEKVLPFSDWVGLDIKAPFAAEKYKKATGGFDQVQKIEKSLDLILDSGIKFECRTTCDPWILSVDDLFEIGQMLKNKGVRQYYLQKYRPVNDSRGTTEADCEKMISDETLIRFLKDSFETFDVRK